MHTITVLLRPLPVPFHGTLVSLYFGVITMELVALNLSLVYFRGRLFGHPMTQKSYGGPLRSERSAEPRESSCSL